MAARYSPGAGAKESDEQPRHLRDRVTGNHFIAGFVALVGLGLPDAWALGRGVLRAQRQYAGNRVPVAEDGNRAEAEVGRVHHAEWHDLQRAVRFDPLDQHRELVHMGDHPGRWDFCGGAVQ
jgi:hypothetical protein